MKGEWMWTLGENAPGRTPFLTVRETWGLSSYHTKPQWDIMVYKMVAPNYKLTPETKQWPCVHSGKGLPLGNREGEAAPADQSQGALWSCGVWHFTKWQTPKAERVEWINHVTGKGERLLGQGGHVIASRGGVSPGSWLGGGAPIIFLGVPVFLHGSSKAAHVLFGEAVVRK